MKKFLYKRTHIPTGKSEVVESLTGTEVKFKKSLAEWNHWAGIGPGERIWKYEAVPAEHTDAEVDLTGIAKTTVELFAERAQQTYTDSVVNLMEEYMLREITKVQRRFPKRAISIMDNQLTTNVHVDGKFITNDDRVGKLFAPLFDVIDWYNKFADDYRVTIGGLTVAPEGYERQWIHERIEYVQKRAEQ